MSLDHISQSLSRIPLSALVSKKFVVAKLDQHLSSSFFMPVNSGNVGTFTFSLLSWALYLSSEKREPLLRIVGCAHPMALRRRRSPYAGCMYSLSHPPHLWHQSQKKFSISQITRRKSFASFSSSSSNFMFSPFFLKFQRVFFFGHIFGWLSMIRETDEMEWKPDLLFLPHHLLSTPETVLLVLSTFFLLPPSPENHWTERWNDTGSSCGKGLLPRQSYVYIT